MGALYTATTVHQGIAYTMMLQKLLIGLLLGCIASLVMAEPWPEFDHVVYSNPQESVQIGRIRFTDCRVSDPSGVHFRFLQCASLLVPEDYSDPAGRKIRLFVARIAASGKKPLPDPFMPISGGPGSAASEIYLFPGQGFDHIHQQRDIFIIDQRGTGKSHKFACESAQDSVWGYTDAARDALQRELKRCLAEFDGNARFYTTSVAVKDYESVRKALGVKQWNVYGASYGTRVAQHYLRRSSDALRSVILDAVVAPQLALGGNIALESQRALDHLVSRCEQDAVCAAHFPNFRSGLKRLFGELREKPKDITFANFNTGTPQPMQLRYDHLAAITRMFLYSPDSLAILPLLFHEAYAKSNFGPLARNADRIITRMNSMVALGMHNSVVCTEDVPFLDISDEKRKALASTYIGDEVVTALADICAIWPAGVIDDDFKTPLENTTTPVLLLSGGTDPITPPSYAETAAALLGNSQHIVAPSMGHGLAAKGCVPTLLAKFVAEIALEKLDVRCIQRLQPEPFFIDFNGPSP